MSDLLFTVGLPRSGKSTWCKDWATVYYVGHSRNPRVIISGDDFRTALHGKQFLPATEGMVFAAMDVAIKALLIGGCDVCVDETCTTEATLLRYLRVDINARPVFIDTTAAICKERAVLSDKPYLLGPIDRMDTQLKELRSRWNETMERLKTYLRSRQPFDITV